MKIKLYLQIKSLTKVQLTEEGLFATPHQWSNQMKRHVFAKLLRGPSERVMILCRSQVLLDIYPAYFELFSPRTLAAGPSSS